MWACEQEPKELPEGTLEWKGPLAEPGIQDDRQQANGTQVLEFRNSRAGRNYVQLDFSVMPLPVQQAIIKVSIIQYKTMGVIGGQTWKV